MWKVAAIALLGALVAIGPARADQTDPRLDDLFSRLSSAGVGEVLTIERSIWHIWAESDDEAISTLMGQGMTAMARGDLSGALGKFDQIVTIAPDYAEGWNKRATVFFLIGNYPESLYDIKRTLALEPRHFGALSGRGLVYVELGEEELALQSFEAALAINPRLTGAEKNAEILRKRLKDNEI